MWRTASSLELLPIGVKTELGEALIKRIKAGDFKESELWCLSRLGARKLFYGPVNLVVPPATVARWVSAVLNLPAAGEALAALAHSDRLLAALDGEEEDDRTLGRIFGEELPSGLVLSEQAASDQDTLASR